MKRFNDISGAHPPDVVLYHADCMDGFGAAWALRKRFSQAEYIPVKHGCPPPSHLNDRHVLIVDFSYQRETIVRLAEQTASLFILDHHVTAQSALEDLPYAYFDMSRSGAVLAWEWAHAEPVPWLLKYVQDKDLWHWELPHSREISAALSSYDFDFAVWDALRFETLQVEGAGIMRYENTLVSKMIEEARMVSLAGYLVPSVHSAVLTSQIGERLSADHPFGIIWHEKDGRRYFSLRSKQGGVSVADIASQFGGGGHTHAAGFSVPLDEDVPPSLDPVMGLPLSAQPTC